MAARRREKKRTLTARKTTPTPLPRGRHDVEDRRAQLIELGLDLFTRYAYDEVSIDEVARMAGISKGLLYHYFPTKRDFYAAVIRRSAEQLLEALRSDAVDPLERLRLGLDGYLAFIARRRAGYVALMRGGAGVDPEIARIVDKTREEAWEEVIAGFPLAAPSPIMRIAVRGWVGFVEAATLDWVTRRGTDVSAAALRDLFVGALIDAVQRAAAP
jgi:AcrR family transcriptional regulator